MHFYVFFSVLILEKKKTVLLFKALLCFFGDRNRSGVFFF